MLPKTAAAIAVATITLFMPELRIIICRKWITAWIVSESGPRWQITTAGLVKHRRTFVLNGFRRPRLANKSCR
jgi:hypothetical protein